MFPYCDEKIIDGLTKSVKVNKAVLQRDKESHKSWQEEYFQRIYTEFKELVKKHNEILGFETEKLITKIDDLELQVKKYENKVKKLKEVNKLINEDE